MRVTVKVIPGAKRNDVQEETGGLKVYLTSPPVDGKANHALMAVLAKHYGVRPNRIEIIKGLKSRHKIVNIDTIC